MDERQPGGHKRWNRTHHTCSVTSISIQINTGVSQSHLSPDPLTYSQSSSAPPHRVDRTLACLQGTKFVFSFPA